MAATPPFKLFIIYAREDQSALLELKAHLRPLERRGDLTVWYDGKIPPGEEWDKVIKEELYSADIILLLVTDAFLDSNYINEIELRMALEKAQINEVVILPIILRDCMWEYSPISHFQVILKDGRPIGEIEGGYVSAARQIAEVVSGLNKFGGAVNVLEDIKDTDSIKPDKSIRIFTEISDIIMQRLLAIESVLKGLQNELERIKAEQNRQTINTLSLYEIRELVSKNQPSSALSQIRKWIEVHLPEKMDDWILISAQFNDYSQNKTLQRTSDSDLQLQNMRILSSIVSLIKACENP